MEPETAQHSYRHYPRLPIPPVLRMSEPDSFAQYTLKERLPAIVRTVISDNDHTPEQAAIVQQSRERLDRSGKYDKPIVTQIKPASQYWLASEEHQQYLEKKQRR